MRLIDLLLCVADEGFLPRFIRWRFFFFFRPLQFCYVSLRRVRASWLPECSRFCHTKRCEIRVPTFRLPTPAGPIGHRTIGVRSQISQII